jgi:hypothetical protein
MNFSLARPLLILASKGQKCWLISGITSINQQNFISPPASRLTFVEGKGLPAPGQPFFVNIQLQTYREFYSAHLNPLSRSMYRKLALNSVLQIDILSAEGNM